MDMPNKPPPQMSTLVELGNEEDEVDDGVDNDDDAADEVT